jgi:hypothetical protein
MADDDHEELPAAMRACLDLDAREGKELFAGFPMPRAVVEVALRKWDERHVRISGQSSQGLRAGGIGKDDREVRLGFEPARGIPRP